MNPFPGPLPPKRNCSESGPLLGDLGAGVFELAPAGALGEDLAAPEAEMAWMRRLSAAIDRPVTYALTQNDHDPEAWRRMLALAREAEAEGARVRAQVAGRPVTLLLGLQTFHPFVYAPSWAELGLLPVDEQAARMGNAAVRERLIREADAIDPSLTQFLDPERVFPFGDEPDYEPSPSSAVAAIARDRGVEPLEVFYDLLREGNGMALLMRPLLNFSDFTLDAVREMLLHPTSAWGLGDGGAHCNTTCDASTPTFMLTHWVRDREHDRLPLEWAVRKMTAETASLYGFEDRGTLTPGMRADVNCIDLDTLHLELPEMVHDLPGGARRFIQRAQGYRSTMVAGEVVLEDGADTGARPGALVRGAAAVSV